MDIERATDEQLIEAARRQPATRSKECVEELYRRFYPRVAYWCLRICGNREEAADLAQDVFLRVHSRLDSFRMQSSFSTWLYTVTRSIAINRGIQGRRYQQRFSPGAETPEPVDSSPNATETVARDEMVGRIRDAMQQHLEPIEARVIYLHFVDGLTLPAITELLGLENKSGAKAFVVSGKRKLRRQLRDPGDGPGKVLEFS